ncbi:hypothetical protein KGA66_16415 [Actinocrinis puniceicyclus]|uniref:RedY protein n=1 Tax=Actinocrinis puniceicyclus TaxID=977794 RepID=A0A8J8BC15_9ACTN|nr:hypothetical protein [Actinocrinis puniceicyclus]MBS2964642.1 hypothetical protein [Actinocrinis puniceicyclus]
MDVIIHSIRLRPGIEPERFERWVRECDYASCPQLPSVVSFSVQRVSDGDRAAADYFEIITVRDRDAFALDMKSAAFGALVDAFDQMAVVVDERAGIRIEPGYAAG